MGRHSHDYDPQTNPIGIPVATLIPVEDDPFEGLPLKGVGARRVETKTVWSDAWHILMRVKKFIVALVGAAATAAYTLPHDPPTRANWQEFIPTAIAFLTALGVLQTKNKEKTQ